MNMRARWIPTGLMLLTALALSACTNVFVQPNRVDYFAQRPLNTPAQTVWLDAVDHSRLHALYLPAQGPLRGTVLHLHGNAENLSSHIHLVSWLPAHGYAVLALDSRGYGASQGTASVAALHQDARTALAYLREQGPASTGPLIMLGQSLGAAVGIWLAASAPTEFAAVIADSAFASYRQITREKLGQIWLTWPLQWPLSWLVSDRFAAIGRVAQISPTPLLLIHGRDDHVIGSEHAQRLYAAAKQPKTLWLIDGGRHIDALRRPAVRERVVTFLDETLALATAQGEATQPDPGEDDDAAAGLQHTEGLSQ